MRWPELPTSTADRAADFACRRFGSISPGARRNGDACTAGDCGVGAVAYPGDAQLNSANDRRNRPDEGARLADDKHDSDARPVSGVGG